MKSMFSIFTQVSRGGVENTRLEVKAKDTQKIRGQGQPSEDRPSRGQGQECSRPRTKDTSASLLQKKGPQKSFLGDLKKKEKKTVFKNFLQAFSSKKRLLKFFSGDLQNFNNSKQSAVLEPRTGQFLRT